MNLFLKAKHWQIFLLTFGLPMLLQGIMMVDILSNVMHNPVPDPFVAFRIFKFFPIIMVVFMGALFGWIWSIAIGLQKFVPAETVMKVKKFKVFFFIPVIYLSIILIVMGLFFNPQFILGSSGGGSGIQLFAIGFAVIFPVHIFSIFCIFYCLYFAAKTYKTAELQRAVGFSDFAGEFFLMWFNPIGVWILQPKINKMVEQQPDAPLAEA
jgi:hypothetical protein